MLFVVLRTCITLSVAKDSLRHIVGFTYLLVRPKGVFRPCHGFALLDDHVHGTELELRGPRALLRGLNINTRSGIVVRAILGSRSGEPSGTLLSHQWPAFEVTIAADALYIPQPPRVAAVNDANYAYRNESARFNEDVHAAVVL